MASISSASVFAPSVVSGVSSFVALRCQRNVWLIYCLVYIFGFGCEICVCLELNSDTSLCLEINLCAHLVINLPQILFKLPTKY